jgi:cell division protein FtsL
MKQLFAVVAFLTLLVVLGGVFAVYQYNILVNDVNVEFRVQQKEILSLEKQVRDLQKQKPVNKFYLMIAPPQGQAPEDKPSSFNFDHYTSSR